MDMSAGINAAVLPLLNQAVRAVASQAANNWRSEVMRAKLWTGEKDAYAQSIKWEMTGDFTAYVSSDYKYAADIETGRPPRDLKKMLDTSSKVRRTKDGRRFLVIPIQHGTPKSNSNPMPSSVAKMARAMSVSTITSTGRRASGEITHLSPKTGMTPMLRETRANPLMSNRLTRTTSTVENHRYAWGDRISKAQLKEAGASKEDQRKYAGMVRMKQSTPGSKRSGYLTFRIMMENSNGWIIPAQPGQYLLKKVVTDLEPKAAAAFTAAIERTVKS